MQLKHVFTLVGPQKNMHCAPIPDLGIYFPAFSGLLAEGLTFFAMVGIPTNKGQLASSSRWVIKARCTLFWWAITDLLSHRRGRSPNDDYPLSINIEFERALHLILKVCMDQPSDDELEFNI